MTDAPRVTFTVEAIVEMDPTRLGELIQDRVRRGIREIRIEELDSVAKRLGLRVVESGSRTAGAS